MEPNPYPRHPFQVEIEELEHDVLEMGSRAESMVGEAVEALCRLDLDLAMRVLEKDNDIDLRDLEIENKCLRLLALHNPRAGDLRAVGSAIKMITDIERVGDLAVDVAKIALKIDKELGSSSFIDIPRIGSVARAMFRESLEAYVRRDVERVKGVIAQDDQVDALYRDLREQIFDHMRRDPEQVVTGGWLLLAIHHVERIADHAVNIAERVNFMVTGEFRQLGGGHEDHLSPRPGPG
jgi:phosphate transport system protein